MQKTIYICLITLFFSSSAFAYGFNEYDPGNGNYGSPYINSGVGINNGTGFWSTNVSREVATVNAMGTNAYLYMKQPPTRNLYLDPQVIKVTDDGWENANSISGYQYTSGDIIEYIPVLWDHMVDGVLVERDFKRDSNGKMQFAYIISNNGQSTFQQTPPSFTPQEINTNMMNTFVSEATRPYFSYNFYNVNTNSFSENIYKATPTGPVIVRSKEIRPYSNIPRVVKENVTFAPGSPFMIANGIYNNNNSSLSLYDGYRIIRDYLDYASPDDVIAQFNDGLGLREREILNKVIPKVRESLPADLKPDAEFILAMYLEQCDENPNVHPGFIMNEFLNMQKVDDVPLPANLPFVDGQNYVFDSEGNPKAAGDAGFLVQIEVNGVKKLPSQLNVNNPAELKALSKVAVCLAKMHGAPVGSWFNTGYEKKSSSLVPAFTLGRKPHMTILNRKGGKFSTDLDNVNSFKNIIQHELGHQYNLKHGIPSNVLTHIDVYIEAMKSINFRDSPPPFKLALTKSLANYIWNMDKKPGYTLQKTIEKINTFNSWSSFNGGYRLIAPKDPDYLSIIIFKRGELGINSANSFRVYNPETHTEEIVNFELNVEK